MRVTCGSRVVLIVNMVWFEVGKQSTRKKNMHKDRNYSEMCKFEFLPPRSIVPITILNAALISDRIVMFLECS